MPAGKDNKITPHYCLSGDTLPLTRAHPKQTLYRAAAAAAGYRERAMARRNNKVRVVCACASNNATCSTFCSILERPTNQMGLPSGCNITKLAARRALVSMFLRWI